MMLLNKIIPQNIFRILVTAGIIFLIISCNNKGIIDDATYKAQLQKHFTERLALSEYSEKDLFSVFDEDLSPEEEEAMQFLFAYMPLCDLAEYDGSFFLRNVRSSLEARKIFPWGDKIPSDIFLHYVLPVRANNEYLDSSRMVFMKELSIRIEGMDMEEAALEVNHWCHEKVCYKPTDGRTSAPLSTVRTSWGRCGEESVFTVAAMRSVGIPARQVYTPRWAHSDDNHAWVEVWIYGEWKYLGACEPGPALNMGWFTEPARRAMLLHTRVFGNYAGDEEIVLYTKNYSELNVTSNYADTKKLHVKVVDSDAIAVEGARVDFGLYNYAEFYPLGKKITDADGMVFLTTGYGDLFVWASHENDFGSYKVSVEDEDTVVVELNCAFPEENLYLYTPPPAPEPLVTDSRLKEENAARLKEEDRTRNLYMESFMDTAGVYDWAVDEATAKQSMEYLIKSMGNADQIRQYITENDIAPEFLFGLLGAISEKDLRDASAEVLTDHLANVGGSLLVGDNGKYNIDFYLKYILNPRVSTEHLGAWRKIFRDYFSDILEMEYDARVASIKKWIEENIIINNEDNHYNISISPLGVFNLRVADERSRDIFFVTLCRALLIPARLDPALRKPQYMAAEKWIDASFVTSEEISGETLNLRIVAGEGSAIEDPLYRIHFSLAKLEEGKFITLDYDWDKPLSHFTDALELPAGTYRLLTANRKENGSVLAKMEHFILTTGDDKIINVVIPGFETGIIGKLDKELVFYSESGNEITAYSLAAGGKAVIAWIDPALEPSRHVINEFNENIARVNDRAGEWYFISIDTGEKGNKAVDGLNDSGAMMLKDPGLVSLKKVLDAGIINKNAEYPVLMVIDGERNIYFLSSGYSVGMVLRVNFSLIFLSE